MSCPIYIIKFLTIFYNMIDHLHFLEYNVKGRICISVLLISLKKYFKDSSITQISKQIKKMILVLSCGDEIKLAIYYNKLI